MISEYAAIRNPFGATNTAMATEMYGGDLWEQLKERFRVEHDLDRDRYIAAGGDLGAPSYVEEDGGYLVDGRIGEWRSEILKAAE